MVGQRRSDVVTRIPPYGQAITGLLHRLALRTDPSGEHRESGAEEDLGVDGGASAAGVAISGESAREGEGEGAVEVASGMILGDIRLDGDEDRTVAVAGLGRAE